MRKDRKASAEALKYLLFTITLLWTFFIFYNSMQTASESLEQSGVFVDMFINLAKIIYGDILPAGLMQYIEFNLVEDVRNIAHLFEFYILYILSNRAFKSIERKIRYSAHAFLYGLIVMTLDETIQIFVDGRGFQFKDIILDSLGLVLAYLTILTVGLIKVRRQIGKIENLDTE
ncbi:MAG: VanZ family protein [Clostridia bacterium]|nr:VanZ family protein [Clostridia bacterium]